MFLVVYGLSVGISFAFIFLRLLFQPFIHYWPDCYSTCPACARLWCSYIEERNVCHWRTQHQARPPGDCWVDLIPEPLHRNLHFRCSLANLLLISNLVINSCLLTGLKPQPQPSWIGVLLGTTPSWTVEMETNLSHLYLRILLTHSWQVVLLVRSK